MDRRELQQLSKMRAAEALCLFASGHFSGSYYLMGYSVECALKAVIASHQGHFAFPDKGFAMACHTHKLSTLLELAGLKREFDQAAGEDVLLAENWSIVSAWNESSRYDVKIGQWAARRMVTACTQQPKGVSPWIQTWISKH